MVLYANGCDGLEEMKTRMYDLERVFVAFYREEFGEGDDGYVLINYIPPSIPAVKRGASLPYELFLRSLGQRLIGDP